MNKVCTCLLLCLVPLIGAAGQTQLQKRSVEYEAVQKRLAMGWNTWDTYSVTSHVLLPEGLAIRIGFYHKTTLYGDSFLSNPLIGRQGKDEEQVFPGPHSWNGSYTELRMTWRGLEMRVQSAHAGSDLVILVTPLAKPDPAHLPADVVFSAGYLWNRSGTTEKSASGIVAKSSAGTTPIFTVGPKAAFRSLPLESPYLSNELSGPVGLSTGKARTLAEIQKILEEQRAAYEKSLGASRREAIDAIQTTIGWDTIYEPEKSRVVSPVSRIWSVFWGGYVLFDWDTFFAATLSAAGSRDLAYANALEILRESTPAGFVPNYARAANWKSFDRSEPAVGSITVLGLYRQFRDKWFLEDSFAPLLAWNRWWHEQRDLQGYIVLGSDGKNQPENLDDTSRGTRGGAILESGLDNSPMYDAAVFDETKQRLLLADVGMTSLYAADCDALAEIATVLGKTAETQELKARAEAYRKALGSLWDESKGMFLNKDLKSGELSPRTSPTNFYPLLAKAATAEQARRTIQEHLLNPQEFWGEWVIPATPRNDPAHEDQDYWRGRVWGPMNYLVYLGLRNYDEPQARRELACKSWKLFEKEWSSKQHVHENYNSILGIGDDVSSSDRFYHWGALLALMELQEIKEGGADVCSVKE